MSYTTKLSHGTVYKYVIYFWLEEIMAVVSQCNGDWDFGGGRKLMGRINCGVSSGRSGI